MVVIDIELISLARLHILGGSMVFEIGMLVVKISVWGYVYSVLTDVMLFDSSLKLVL